MGGFVKREYYLSVVAILVESKTQKFLPGIKRIFLSMKPNPPQRNRQAEQALVGGSFGANDTNDSGSFSSTYAFYQDGTFKKMMMFSSGEVGGSTEDFGRYEVVGDIVYLSLESGQETMQVVVNQGYVSLKTSGGRTYSR